jgi:hypothetical protein
VRELEKQQMYGGIKSEWLAKIKRIKTMLRALLKQCLRSALHREY